MNKAILILLALLSLAATPRQTIQHKHVPAAVAKLDPLGYLESTNRIHLSISLPLRNQAGLDELLKDLYNPASTNYHHWLTNGEFASRFGPTANDYEAAASWAKSKGLSISSTQPSRHLLSVYGDTPVVDKAFSIRMKKYRHPHDGRSFHSPDREPTISIPGLSNVDVSGFDDYGKMVSTIATNHNKVIATVGTGSGSGGSFLGYDFRRAYVPGTALTGAGQNIGSVQFDNFNVNDIIAYRTAAGLPAITIVKVPVDGGTAVGPNTEETCLDIEMQYSMAPGATLFIYDAPNSTVHWNNMIATIANANDCQQISCSWADFNGSYGGYNPSYFSFMQMAAQGQSFFTSSGDYAAYVYGDGTYVPFPAVFTNVTVVGGTTLTMSGAGSSYTSEIVWNDYNAYGTGGGVNLFYDIPDYQMAVTNWAANKGDPTSRNLPDVAMVADNIYVFYSGIGVVASGTSASAPLWAGLCALINQRAAAAGKPTVGWLNPSIYKLGTNSAYSSCFHDITIGNNEWPQSPNLYPAVTGYDLCTGWGTPGTNLINALYTGPKFISLQFTNGLFQKAY